MSGLIIACASSGQLKRAWQTWLILTAKGLGPDLVAHNTLLAALAAAGAAAEALEVYRSMKVGEVRALAYMTSCWPSLGTGALAAQLSSCIVLPAAVPAREAAAQPMPGCRHFSCHATQQSQSRCHPVHMAAPLGVALIAPSAWPDSCAGVARPVSKGCSCSGTPGAATWGWLHWLLHRRLPSYRTCGHGSSELFCLACPIQVQPTMFRKLNVAVQVQPDPKTYDLVLAALAAAHDVAAAAALLRDQAASSIPPTEDAYAAVMAALAEAGEWQPLLDLLQVGSLFIVHWKGVHCT